MLGVLYGQIGVSPPPPPPPPPSVGTTIADVVVAQTGIIELGVPVSTSIMATIGMARLGSNVAQVDNISKDLSGYVRWFMLTANVSAATYPLIVDTSVEPNAAVTWFDAVPTSIHFTVSTSSPVFSTSLATTQTSVVYWRQGPVVTERYVWASVTGTMLHTHFYISKYADGNSRTTLLVENGWSDHNTAGGNVPLLYAVSIQRGASSIVYPSVMHYNFGRYVRRIGTSAVHAQVVPHGWAANTCLGTYTYFRGTKLLQNFQTLQSMPTSIAFVHVSAPASPGVGEQYTPDTPFSKTLTWDGSQWTGAGGPADSGSIGQYTCAQGAPGDNSDIGPHPGYYQKGLANFGPDGKQMLVWHADKRQESPFFYRSVSTRSWYRIDGPKYMNSNIYSTGNEPNIALSSAAVTANQMWENAHWGAMFYLPYIATGDPVYIEGQWTAEFWSWVQAGINYGGQTNVNTSWSSDPLKRHAQALYWTDFMSVGTNIDGPQDGTWGFAQQRAMSWAVRNTLHNVFMLPEDDNKTRGIGVLDKTTARTHFANLQDSLHTAFVSLNTGSIGTGLRFLDQGGYRRTQGQASGSEQQWMCNMGYISFGHGNELGALTTAGRNFLVWILEGRTNMINDPQANFEFLIGQPDIYSTDVTNGSGSKSRYPVSVYLFQRTVAHAVSIWPEPGTPPFVKTTAQAAPENADWSAYTADTIVYAVDMSVSGAVSAYAFVTAYSQHFYGTTYMYGPNHSIRPRTSV